MPNRLAGSLSPYLLQHQDNPIDWWPWGDEVWELARREDKPVFLSVGYSSCHWCHVMAHESFEDPEVAAALNRDFVCIKLDREERPDIDEVYMTAVQMATGQGGWPMSVFLTPDMKPFFAGTYFPRESRGGHPSFLTIINSLAQVWQNERSQIQKSADDFATALNSALERTLPASGATLGVELLDHAVEALHQDFDDEHGGFGGRPKFPPHATLRFLLDYAVMRPDLGGDAGDLPDRAAHMAIFTLRQICLGGICDHVGGGFHRYSTDERWLLPHFEKTLYDNAQLLSCLTHAAEVVADAGSQSLFKRRANRLTEWLTQSMTDQEGLFCSALDADSEGREGAYYVWTADELQTLLGSDFDAFSRTFQVTVEGNFEDEATRQWTGENVLYLAEDDRGSSDRHLATLEHHRSRRPAPLRDGKAIAAWNGLMIGALAQMDSNVNAVRAAMVWASHISGSGLPHMVTDGQPGGKPFLDDVACLADGLLDLAESTSDDHWNRLATQLADQMVSEYKSSTGAFQYSPVSFSPDFVSTQPFMDNATPSPNGMAARVLRRLGRDEECLTVLTAGLGWMASAPQATQTLLREALWFLAEHGTMAPTVGGLNAEVTATLSSKEIKLDPEGWAHTEIHLTVPTGWHINSNEPAANWLVPLAVEVDGAFGEAAFPEDKNGTYEGTVPIAVRLRTKGDSRDFALRVSFQACTDTECAAPQSIELTGTITGP